MISSAINSIIVDTNYSTMNNTISANELKTKGISAAEFYLKKGLETIITVRGKEKYVMVTKDEYTRLRECEIFAALAQAEEDIKKGKFYEGSVEDHFKRITNA